MHACAWRRLGRLAHFLAGLVSALAVEIHWALTLVGFLVFLVYEGDEEKVLGDALFQEMLEYGLGFYAGATLLLCLRVV